MVRISLGVNLTLTLTRWTEEKAWYAGRVLSVGRGANGSLHTIQYDDGAQVRLRGRGRGRGSPNLTPSPSPTPTPAPAPNPNPNPNPKA